MAESGGYVYAIGIEESKAPKKRRSTEKSRAAHRRRSARYYARHKTECKERMRRYHAATREKGRERLRRWRHAHPEQARGHSREQYWSNPERGQAFSQQWRAAHPEYASLYQKRSYARNPERVINQGHIRRAKQRAAPHNDLTAAQWREIKEHYGYCCVYCGKQAQRLTMDHLTPIARGGSHTVSNVVPACRSCNSRKRVGPVLVPVQPLLLTIASRGSPSDKRRQCR
jgi:hypothetical protein